MLFQKMNMITRRIFNYNDKYVQTLILRLYKNSYYTLCINNTSKWKIYLVEYKYFHQYKQESIESNDITNVPRTKKMIREHQLMHSFFKNSVYYKNSIVQPIKAKMNIASDDIKMLENTNWSKTKMSILNALKKLMYCHLNNVQFDDQLFEAILKGCCDKLLEFDDNEIQRLMQYLIVLNKELKASRICLPFMKQLNAECLKRFYDSDIRKLLFTIDAFYQLNDFYSNYSWRALRKINTKLYKIPSKQFVQFLFYLSIFKVPEINMYEVQCYFDECLHEITADEIGIAARGFFLNKTKISYKPLMSKIMKKLSKNTHTISEVNLGAVMKLIRYSDCCHCMDDLYSTLVALRSKVPHLALPPLVHIAHTAAGQRVYDKILMDEIVKRLITEIKWARLKDIERIIFTLCTIGSITEHQDTCDALVNELLHTYQTTRSQEIHLFMKSFIRILAFLTYRNIYPQKLIEYALNPNFVAETYNNNLKLLTNELLILDCSVKIEMPNYTGPFLDNKIYNFLTKKYCRKSDAFERYVTIKLRTEISYICKENLGLDIHVDWILPHTAATDIIFGFDKDNKSVSIEPILSTMPFGSIKRVDTNELSKIKWKVLLILHMSHQVTGRQGYIGPIYAKFRQLKTIGYTPIMVCGWKWKILNTEEKENYLKQIIFQENNSNDLQNL